MFTYRLEYRSNRPIASGGIWHWFAYWMPARRRLLIARGWATSPALAASAAFDACLSTYRGT